MKVLVAIDDSKFSEAVIEELATRPWSENASVRVVHVVAVPHADCWQDWGLGVETQLLERLDKDAQAMVLESITRLKQRLGKAIKIDGQVVNGQICESIAQIATDWNADLIVMGSHGRSGLQKFLLGSVAEGVLLCAPCSVEIIKSRQESATAQTKKKKAVLVY